MAIVVIGEIPGGNAQMDQGLMQAVGISPGNPPAGALMRMSGPMDGGYRIISVWELEDAWQIFRRDKLEPAFKQMGRELPEPKVSQLDNVMIAPQR